MNLEYAFNFTIVIVLIHETVLGTSVILLHSVQRRRDTQVTTTVKNKVLTSGMTALTITNVSPTAA